MAAKSDIVMGFVIGFFFLFLLGIIVMLVIGISQTDEITGSADNGTIALVEIVGPIYDAQNTVRQLKKWRKDSQLGGCCFRLLSRFQ